MMYTTAFRQPDDAGSSTPNSPILAAALDLAARGFPVFPVNREKKPLAGMHGFKDATRDEAVIRGWFANAPGRQLAVATGGGLLVVDLDCKGEADGPAALLALEAQHDDLPETPRVRTPSGGAHLWFTYDPALDLRCSAGRLGPGIDVRASGGYVVAPPSVVTSGGGYIWDIDLDSCDPPPAPQWLMDLIMTPARAEAPPDLGGADKVQELINESRQPGRWHSSVLRLTAHLTAIGVPTSAILAMAAEITLKGYTVEQTRDELQEMIDGARAKGWMPHPPCSDEVLAALLASSERKRNTASAGTEALEPEPERDPAASEMQLPDRFWHSSEWREQLRGGARYSRMNEVTLLGAVLSRAAAMVPPGSGFCTGIGGTTIAPMNLLCCVVAVSGGAKTQALLAAEDIVPRPALLDVEEAAIGSGEGIIDSFMGSVPNENGKGSTIKQVRNNAWLYLDEGEALFKLAAQPGNTTMQTLRSAFSGAPIGTANSLAGGRRRKATNYNVGFCIGLQPCTVAPLLADVGGGTPQRALFFRAFASLPKAWPRVPMPTVDVSKQIVAGFVPDVLDEIRRAYDERERRRFEIEQSGERDIEFEWASHDNLQRCKVASLFAVIDGRDMVTADDWAMAGILVGASIATRTWLRHEVARQADAERCRIVAERADSAAVTRLAQDSAAVDLGKVSRRLAAKVWEHGRTPIGRCRANFISTSKRAWFDRACSSAVAANWIVADGTHLAPGAVRP